ncbi:ribosomal L7Ae/L30e/S12e/Gadd45 family protein [Nanoarchaeota archaeon]
MADEGKAVLDDIAAAKNSSRLRKGTNEVTKAIEKGKATVVAIAKDVSPPEITMHIPLLCKEKDIKCVEIESKEELGAAAGITVGTAAVAIVAEKGKKSDSKSS